MILDTIWAGAQHVCGVEVPKNSSRRAEHVRVRWLAMYVARRRGFSFADIGRFFGMHHTNVMHGVLSAEQLDLNSRERAELSAGTDPVNHPKHYISSPRV